jgi:hypothetical protein
VLTADFNTCPLGNYVHRSQNRERTSEQQWNKASGARYSTVIQWRREVLRIQSRVEMLLQSLATSSIWRIIRSAIISVKNDDGGETCPALEGGHSPSLFLQCLLLLISNGDVPPRPPWPRADSGERLVCVRNGPGARQGPNPLLSYKMCCWLFF